MRWRSASQFIFDRRSIQPTIAMRERHSAERPQSSPLDNRFGSQLAVEDPETHVRSAPDSGKAQCSQLSSPWGRVEMWRGGGRLNISVGRLFRLAVP
jgi:hypothetical protein